MLKETYEITNRGKERLFIKYKNMKITSPMFIKKAVEQYANYVRRKEDETAFSLTQKYLEDLAIACKEKGIKEINGQNYTLTMN